jgi:two-component system nitrate/nitrite response regulator NarL
MTPNTAATSAARRILLIDDLPLRRASLKRLLEDWMREGDSTLEVTDAVASMNDSINDICLAIFNVGETPADAPWILDKMAELARRMQGVPIVILSDRDGAADVIAALKAGARGFITTSTDPVVMFRAVKFIIGGGAFFPPDTLLNGPLLATANGSGASLDVNPAGSAEKTGNTLTLRQNDVLQLLGHGKSNKLIALELGMQESTVKVHVRQIMRKLGASNRTQAALSALEQRLADAAAVKSSESGEERGSVDDKGTVLSGGESTASDAD